ncbi:MAG: histidine kinase [Peptococcaceae bacterium BICA1-7]|nr:MAG: histidine kinase [Peptococcaceae bacterium BICA1-7]HBV98362.1 PAS domain-containing protein [Desulfotomaculum sp.]
MKFFTELKNTPIFIGVFFLSIIIVLGIVEFGFLKNILVNYEDNIKQVAINKTTLLLNDIKSISEKSVKSLEPQDHKFEASVKAISDYDHRITNVYLLDADGTTVKSLNERRENPHIRQIVIKSVRENSREVTISQVHIDPVLQTNIVSAVIPLTNNTVWLGIDFSVDQYQREMIHEFANRDYKIAVLDAEDNPVVWPFDSDQLNRFARDHKEFYSESQQYNVIHSDIGEPAWRMYFFFKENNFEQFRTITILFLVFALYCCLYQLLVELWGVNSVKTYFENIDFAILNQVNEGVIITNNSGRIVFANNTANEIFAQRKSTLVNIRLKEILGHLEDIHDEKEKAIMFTLKMPDKFLEAIHSPIIKKGKRLGSLTVIRVDIKEEKNFRIVLNKLVDIIPEGVVYVDKNHEISAANLMAKCYLGNLEKGTSIDVVDPRLAEFIYENIGSGTVKRLGLTLYGLSCEISPVYDDDGVYAGTLVVLLNDLESDQKNMGKMLK